MALEIEVKSNSRQARSDLDRLNRSVDNISKTTSSMARNLQRSVAIIGTGIAGLVAAKGLTSVVDKFTNIENRIALVTGRTKELTTTFADLQQVAIRSRGSLEGIADLYNRLGRSSRDLGVSNKEIIAVTESIQKAIVISGSSAESANAAIIQLGQGLAAGALRGQELNSVMEQTPRVASAIAAELGVGIGGLRKMAEEGKITSEVVIRAFKSQASVIDEEFKQVDATVGQGFQQVGQGIGLVVASFIKGSGAASAFSKKLLEIGAALSAAAPQAEKLGEELAIFFGTKQRETTFDLVLDSLKELGTLGSGFIGSMVSEIVDFASILGQKALPFIQQFTSAVNDMFKWVYIQVVGNSWWPDLVDEVVDYTDYIFEALFKIEDFTSKVSGSFKRALETVKEGVQNLFGSDALGTLQEGIIITISARQLNLSSMQSILLGVGSLFIEEMSKVVDYIRTEFPQVFSVVAGAAAVQFVKTFGNIYAAIAVALGGALSAGLSARSIIDVIEDIVVTLSVGLGRAVGSIFANLPEFAIGFGIALFKALSEFGQAFLRELGPVGQLLNAIFGSLGGVLVGSVVTAFISINFGKLLFGSKFASAAQAVFSRIKFNFGGKGTNAQDFLGLTSIFNMLEPAIGRVGKKMKALIGLIAAGDFASFGKDIASITSSLIATGANLVATTKATIASTIAWVSNTAAVVSFNASLLIATALQYGAVFATGLLTAATGALTAAMTVARLAASAMWLAVGGPIGVIAKLLIGVTGLFLAFGAASAKAADNVEEIDRVAGRARNNLFGIFGQGFNLDIKVTVEEATVEDAFEAVQNANEELLVNLNRDTERSSNYLVQNISESIDDIGTDLEIGMTSAFTSAANAGKVALNEVAAFSNNVFGSNFDRSREEETRSAVDQLLDEKGEGLKLEIEFEVDDKSLKTILDEVDPTQFGALVAAQQELSLARQEYESAIDFEFVANKDILALLQDQIDLKKSSLDILVRQLNFDVLSTKALNERTEELTKFNGGLEEGTTIFGEQLIQGKSILALAKLNTSEADEYNKRLSGVRHLTTEIRTILIDTNLTEDERNDAIALRLKELTKEQIIIDQIGESLQAVSMFDLADSLGFSDEQSFGLDEEQLSRVGDIASQIRDAEFALDQAVERKAGAIELGQLQTSLFNLRKTGQVVFDDISRELNTNVENLVSDLALADVSLAISDVVNLTSANLDKLKTFAETSKTINDDLVAAIAAGDKDREDELRAELATVGNNAGKFLGEAIDKSLQDNFQQVLDPFRQLGVNFDTDAFKDLGKSAVGILLAQATDLAAQRKTLADQVFKTDEDRYNAIAAFNVKLMDFEEDLRKAQEDRMANERNGEQIASSLSGNIMSALRGDKSFGEAFKDTFLQSVENGLQSRMTDFFSGAFERVFDMSDEGAFGKIGKFFTELITPPSNEESDGIKEAGAGFFSKLFGEDSLLGGLFGGITDLVGGIFGGPKGELPAGSLPSKPMYVKVIDGIKGAIGGFGGAGGKGGDAGDTTGIFGDPNGMDAIPDGDIAGSEVSGVLDALGGGEDAEEAGGGFLSGLKGIFNGFKGGLGGLFDGVLGGFGGVFKGLLGSLGGLFSGGGGGGGGFGGLLTSFAGFFNDGGIVPGGGPTPVIAHGGEMILNKRQQKHLFDQADKNRNGQSGTNQAVNINVTGDISRQTKKEILTMIPTIATGVGQFNREQNR